MKTLRGACHSGLQAADSQRFSSSTSTARRPAAGPQGSLAYGRLRVLTTEGGGRLQILLQNRCRGPEGSRNRHWAVPNERAHSTPLELPNQKGLGWRGCVCTSLGHWSGQRIARPRSATSFPTPHWLLSAHAAALLQLCQSDVPGTRPAFRTEEAKSPNTELGWLH